MFGLRVEVAHRDVLRSGHVVGHVVLEHRTDPLAQVSDIHVADIDPVPQVVDTFRTASERLHQPCLQLQTGFPPMRSTG